MRFRLIHEALDSIEERMSEAVKEKSTKNATTQENNSTQPRPPPANLSRDRSIDSPEFGIKLIAENVRDVHIHQMLQELSQHGELYDNSHS